MLALQVFLNTSGDSFDVYQLLVLLAKIAGHYASYYTHNASFQNY